MTRIRSALTEAGCAEVVGRSTSLIRKWADPDHPSVPNVMQALQLDAAYVGTGKGEAPILKLYQELLEDVEQGRDTSRDEIVPSALMVQVIVGDLSEAIREAIGSGELAIGSNLSQRRRARVLEIIDRLEDETDRLEDAIEATDD